MLQTSSSFTAPAWIERRQSVRFPANDEAQIEIAGDPVRKVTGFLRDVSQNGVRVALPERVETGAAVKIWVAGGVVLEGQIRYCRSAGSVYYAGVLIHAQQACAAA
jgi:PilZ domain